MKSILATAAALAMTAGLAAAEDGVKFSGAAKFGFNDKDHELASSTATSSGNTGFYAEADLDVALTRTLDNGLKAKASFDVEYIDVKNSATEDLSGKSLTSANTVISLSSDTYGVYYGDTNNAAKTVWSAVGSMDQDTFRTLDGENNIRAEVKVGGAEVFVSVASDGANDDNNGLTAQAVETDSVSGTRRVHSSVTNLAANDNQALAAGFKATVQGLDISFAYQEANTLKLDDDDNGESTRDQVTAARIGMTFAGADIALGYASRSDGKATEGVAGLTASTSLATTGTSTNPGGSSIGLSVSYPIAPLTVKASYVAESLTAGTTSANWDFGLSYSLAGVTFDVATDEDSDWSADVGYDMGNGINLFAGVDDEGQDTYFATTYDLGGGATALLSYASDNDFDNGDDEIGNKDYKEGLTVQVSFAF